MGQKMSGCFGSGDTPIVTMKCIFVNRSSAVEIDLKDGKGEEQEYEIKKFCCFQWLRRKENETSTTTGIENEPYSRRRGSSGNSTYDRKKTIQLVVIT
jgi:hypothetical protein